MMLTSARAPDRHGAASFMSTNHKDIGTLY